MCKSAVLQYTGFLSIGGYGEGGHSSTAEIFNPRNGHSCKIGDLPVATVDATICKNIVCGGEMATQSCFQYDGVGTFTALPVTLINPRTNHLCWSLPSGEILLLGGQYGSQKKTEKISVDGSSSTADFDLPYDIEYFETSDSLYLHCI